MQKRSNAFRLQRKKRQPIVNVSCVIADMFLLRTAKNVRVNRMEVCIVFPFLTVNKKDLFRFDIYSETRMNDDD